MAMYSCLNIVLLSLTACFLGIILPSVSADYIVEYQCVTNGTLMSVTIDWKENDQTFTLPKIFTANFFNDPGCSSTTVLGNNQLTVSFNAGDCGYVLDTSTAAPNDYSVLLYFIKSTTTSATFFNPTDDRKSTITCDYDTVQTVTILNADVVNITESLTSINATAIEEVISLEIVDAANPTNTIGTCDIGDSTGAGQTSMKIRLTLTPDANKAAKGIKAVSCTAKPSAASATSVALFLSYCRNGALSFFPDSTLGFTGDAANGVVILSATFPCFQWTTGETQLYFTCLVRYCTANGDATCAGDQCVNNAGNGRRRRRDTSSANDEAVVKASAIIEVGTSTVYKKELYALQPVQPDNKEKTAESCMQSMSFIVILAILAVLLILAIGASIYLCLRVGRMQVLYKEGFQNDGMKL